MSSVPEARGVDAITVPIPVASFAEIEEPTLNSCGATETRDSHHGAEEVSGDRASHPLIPNVLRSHSKAGKHRVFHRWCRETGSPQAEREVGPELPPARNEPETEK